MDDDDVLLITAAMEVARLLTANEVA